MSDLRADLAALLAKVERMTPGPWRQGNMTGEWPARFAGPLDVVAPIPPPDSGPDGTWIALSANSNFRDEGAANAAGIVALRNAAPYLAALARIAEIVAVHDSRVDYAGDALDEIRAVLDGAVTP